MTPRGGRRGGRRRQRPPWRNAVAAGAVLAGLGLVAAACGRDENADPARPGANVGGGFPASRCESNRAAGKILFLTSFDYAAAASIIDVVAAKEEGYFEQVCLDVELQPGFSTANVAVVAAGRAQMTSLGSFSEVVVANSNEADLVAVGVEGKTSIEELLVDNDDRVTKLTDLAGKNVGIKGAIPFSIRAMLAKAGVDEGSLEQIEVGFNPVVLFEQDIAALPVYKSNEPFQLDAAGYEGRYTAFDPASANVPASFAVFTTSRHFATDHPTAVADFLRASLRGFEWAEAHPDAAVDLTIERSDPQNFFTPEGERFRWATEAKLVREATPAGQPIGAVDRARLQAEIDFLVEAGVVDANEVDATSAADPSFVDEVTDGDRVVWYG